MNIDPKDLTTLLIAIAPALGGYFVMREKVARLEGDVKEARDSALRAHGADDAFNARVVRLESSVESLKESQDEHARRVEESNRGAVAAMHELVKGLSGEVRRLFEKVHEIDKAKADVDTRPGGRRSSGGGSPAGRGDDE